LVSGVAWVIGTGVERHIASWSTRPSGVRRMVDVRMLMVMRRLLMVLLVLRGRWWRLKLTWRTRLHVLRGRRARIRR
jgi:hypothetical protein